MLFFSQNSQKGLGQPAKTLTVGFKDGGGVSVPVVLEFTGVHARRQHTARMPGWPASMVIT